MSGLAGTTKRLARDPTPSPPEETDARPGGAALRSRCQGRPVTELASTMTPSEIASQAAHAITVLNELTHGGGELSNPGDVRAIVGSLELIGQSLPQLYEQLARFLVVQHEDGQLAHEAGRDSGDSVPEVIAALR